MHATGCSRNYGLMGQRSKKGCWALKKCIRSAQRRQKRRFIRVSWFIVSSSYPSKCQPLSTSRKENRSPVMRRPIASHSTTASPANRQPRRVPLQPAFLGLSPAAARIDLKSHPACTEQSGPDTGSKAPPPPRCNTRGERRGPLEHLAVLSKGPH